MDSPDIDSNETVQHQSTIEQVVTEDVQPQLQPSGNPNDSIKAPEIVPDKTSNEPALSSRTSSDAGDQTQPLPTHEETVDHEPKVDLEKDKLSVSTEDLTVSLPTKDKPEDQISCEPSSSSSITSSSITTVEEVKQMSRRQLATVLILCFVNLLKYMDRFTIAGILPEIQCFFGISDAQGGLLSTAFVVSYMLFSPLVGYLGDRFSRRIIMGCGIIFWGLSNLAGSFTETYSLFLTSRILVGIGESMFSTVSPTIISDVCVGDTRSKFLILYYFAIPVGSGLGFIVGAAMASAFGSWQWGLRVTPFLGLIAVLLIFFIVQEPPRGEAEGSTLSPTTYWDDLKYLAKNKSYVLSTAGCTLTTYVSGALAWWGPKFITLGQASGQGLDVSYTRVSLVVGFEAALAGVVGVASGSLVGQKFRKRFPTADAQVCAWSMVICAPLLYWGCYIATGPPVPLYIVLFFGQWFLNVSWAPVGDILLYVVIPTRRSTAEAFSILISHALGDAGSPYIVGLVSDSFKKSLTAAAESKTYLSNDYYDGTMVLDQSSSSNNCSGSSFIDPETVDIDFRALQYSLFITTIIAALSAYFFFLNAWYIVEDKAAVAKAVKENEELMRIEKIEKQDSANTKSELSGV
ncbi:protein spinster homolog 1-like [Daphnia pulex]|uniref:protein spinster homolog 1-like n=1 Tax=Daphnia pulex TaxID=6669 RepID=UPI001EDF6FEB|nr:protein spinster homolog 1-like [Daphnia pulex]XP_046461984.1 protein spinster homolog 1-like [Daphnia pulex]